MSWARCLLRAVLATAALACAAISAAGEQRAAVGFTPTAAQCAALPELDARIQAITSCKKAAAGAKVTAVRPCVDWWLGWLASCLAPPECHTQVGAYYSHLTGAMALKDRSAILKTAGLAEAVNGQLRISCAATAAPAKPPPAAKPPAGKPPAVKPPAITTGLGADVDKLVEKSPTLLANLKRIQGFGTIKYGEAGKGTYWDPNTKTMVIDPNQKGDALEVVTSLAHESGHALYRQPPVSGRLSREEFIKRSTSESLKNEGEATLVNIKIQQELAKQKVDITVAGRQIDKFAAIAKKYPAAKDRDKARQEIAELFRKGESPSTDGSDRSYEEVYGEDYGKIYDRYYAKKKP